MTNSNDKGGELLGQERLRNGINANQLFLWRKLYQDASLSAVSAGEELMGSEVRTKKYPHELGRTTLKQTRTRLQPFFLITGGDLVISLRQNHRKISKHREQDS